MANKPNVLLITADQMQRKALSVYGNRVIKTPNLHNLAIDGVVMDHHIIQNPVCSPSRATILTGRYPRNHGLRENGCNMRPGEHTLASILKKEGYHTGAIGKMHLTPQLPVYYDDENWPEDDFGFMTKHLTCDNKSGEYLEWLKENDIRWYEYVRKQGEDKIAEDIAEFNERSNELPPQVKENLIPVELHQTTWIADHTIELIKKCEGNPFFIWCSFVDPHHPFDPPEPYASMYDIDKIPIPPRKDGEMGDKPPHFNEMLTGKSVGNEKYDLANLTDEAYKTIIAKYYGMITFIDDQIGRILNYLKKCGEYDNTIIIFTADHGELMGDHRLLFKGPFHYDSLIRVPMIMKYGTRIGGGSRVNGITQHTDILPTILQLTGIPVPEGVQGRSMLNVINGEPGYDFALIEHNSGDWGLNIKTIRSKEWRLTYYANQDFGELYDLRKDADEFINLWDNPDYTDIKNALIRKLLDKVLSTEDTLPIRSARY
ncbi:MAG TPA: sulfatase-like hydrolase/transferase [Clostridiales bacterium]|nr:sulfatase-like hydrolase/transferase [Clostridiales bacterium]